MSITLEMPSLPSKALQKASAEGQRIYHITKSNKSTILSHIHYDAATMTEISNALNPVTEWPEGWIQTWFALGEMLLTASVS